MASSNVFDQFKLETKELTIKGLGKVTIRPMSLKEFMNNAKGFDTKDQDKMMALQFKIVSDCLVEPKMTVKQLEALGQGALEPITEIFIAIRGDEDEGKN